MHLSLMCTVWGITANILVWFKFWSVMLPVCIQFEVLVFPVKMMNRWDYSRNFELYLTRFWHFGAFSLPVSLSPVWNLPNHPKSLNGEYTWINLSKSSIWFETRKTVHTISQQIIQIYSWEFAELTSRLKIFQIG